MVREQRSEIAQLAAGIDRAGAGDRRALASAPRSCAGWRDSRRAASRRRSPIGPVTIPDTGEALVSEPTAEALEQLAWLEGQTSAIDDSVTLLSTLVAARPRRRRHAPLAVAGVGADLVGVRRPVVAVRTAAGSSIAGLDIRALSGTPVAATGGGVVVYAGRMSGYGNMVVVDHGFELKTVYAHLSAIYTDVGQRVQAGEVIGAVGADRARHGPAPALRGARRHRAGRSPLLHRRSRPPCASARVDHGWIVGLLRQPGAELAVVGP